MSKIGKEATIGILNEGDFFGEGCLTGQLVRLSSASAMTDCSVMRIDKKSMMEVLHREHAFSDMFVAYLLTRNIRYEEDLVDQLFNSSEKRLARVLLLLAHFGKDGKPEVAIPKISQETLAEMVGTTRSRVSFFMNRFRKLGFIRYQTASLKSTVHFSTLFSTTRTSSEENGALLSCRASHSRLRHFLGDFGECRFGRLLFYFSFAHMPHDSHESGPFTGQFGSRDLLLTCYNERRGGYHLLLFQVF